MTKILCVRSQKSAGASACSFGGPDKYVAVQIVPEGIEPLKCLNGKVAAKRGIKIIYFGEGYSRHTGPQSMFGRALKAAKEFVAQ